MLKTIEQFQRFVEGMKRKNFDVVFYKNYKELNIRNSKKGYWFIIPISDTIHDFLAEKCNYRYHIVMNLEKEEEL